MQARVKRFLAEMTNRTLFFSLWWKALDDADADRLMASKPGVSLLARRNVALQNAHAYRSRREGHQHRRTSPAQRLPMTLYDAITNRYVFKLEVAGETKELTQGELTAYVHNPDPDLRAAYQELYRADSRCAHPWSDLSDLGARLAQ